MGETSWPFPFCPNPSYQPLAPSEVLESAESLLRAKEYAQTHTSILTHTYMCMRVHAHTQYAKKNNVHWVPLKKRLLVLALACGRKLHLGVWAAAGHDA